MSSEQKLNAYEFLELIQKKYLELKGRNQPLQFDKSVEDFIKNAWKDIDVSQMYSVMEEQMHRIIPCTKYQAPHTYFLLYNIIQDIEKIKTDIFKHTDLDIRMPCFGTVDYDIFSAEICAPNCNEKLIIISDGLFTFANLISKIITLAFPFEVTDKYLTISTDMKEIKKYIENHTEVKLRFYDLMLACLLSREPPRAKQYFINHELDAMLSTIRDSFETFVVAHEYAHSILGHLEDKKINSTASIDELRDSEIKEIFHSWQDEVDADIHGAGITLSVMAEKGYDPYVSMIGIIVCVNSFELFDKIEVLRSGNTKERKLSPSHPPGSVREKLIEEAYFEDQDIRIFETIDTIFSDLWNDFVVFYEKFKENMEQIFNIDIYKIPFGITQSIMFHIMTNKDQ